jgi:hypothetical protein
VDRDGGFEKATLIYDRDGRLIAVDYQMPAREPVPHRSPDAGE